MTLEPRSEIDLEACCLYSCLLKAEQSSAQTRGRRLQAPCADWLQAQSLSGAKSVNVNTVSTSQGQNGTALSSAPMPQSVLPLH